jgi:hypothetical protein
MTADQGWSRETFSFAFALRNLIRGELTVIAGTASVR